MAYETRHCNSNLLDDIFAPTAVIESTKKFKPKPHIINKKILPIPSKSAAVEGPASSSNFARDTNDKVAVKGCSNPSAGSTCSSVSSITHSVAQNPEGNIEYSESSDAFDEVPLLGLGEPKQCTGTSDYQESVDGCNKSFSVSETLHSDSDLVDDIFAPATALGKTTKFKPKPRIINQKHLPKLSKSGATDGPSPSSKLPDAVDSKGPAEGSSGPCSELHCSSTSSSAHVVQNPEENIEYSISNNVLDNLSQLSVKPQKYTDIPSCLGILDGCNISFTVSAEPVNLVHNGSDAADILFEGFDSTVRSLSELRASVSPLGNIDLAFPAESAEVGANAYQLSADIQSSRETTILSSVGDSNDSAPVVNARSGSVGPIFTSNQKLNENEAISVSSDELEEFQSSLLTKGFAANVEAFHPSQSVANLQGDYVEPATVHTILDPVDDFFSQSDQPAVKQIGKFRPKPSLQVKERKRTKTVSFILPNDGKSSKRITSIIKMSTNENMGLLSECNKDNQADRVSLVSQDVIDTSSFNTLDILSEPMYNSDELVEKFQNDLQGKTKSVEAISVNGHGFIDFGTPDLDSLHIQSAATCDAPINLSDDQTESFTMKMHNNFLTNTSQDRACFGNDNDLVDQSLVENEDLCNMEGEHKHTEKLNLEACSPNIVQNEEDERSSRRVRQSKRKLKSSEVDSMVSEDHVDCNKDEDVPEKRKMKATRSSSSRSSGKERSIGSSKEASEKPDSTKDPPRKRLPHGSRSKSSKRQVNMALLGIPDDELNRKQLAIRDLIRLAGFKERILNKEASSSNQSEENEQDADADDARRNTQGGGPRLNYHSYMRRPQRARWSNAETELFYQAIRQFGTDFEMIQLLFPDRSRQQVKAKFKNEQRKHPLQIADAAVSRSKDHSHFEKVIQHLQAVAALNSRKSPSESQG